jgi:hypothetical protein
MSSLNAALQGYPYWDPTKLVAVDRWGDRVAAALIIGEERDDIVLLRKIHAGGWRIISGGGSNLLPGWSDELLQRVDLPMLVSLSQVISELFEDTRDGEEDVVRLTAISGLVAASVKELRLIPENSQTRDASRRITLSQGSRFFVAVDVAPYSLYPLDSSATELDGKLIVS